MDRATYKHFKQLLLAQAFWQDESERRAFLDDVFWKHPIMDHLDRKGTPDVVATALLTLCDREDAPGIDGLTPACALLTGIRERGQTAGGRGSDIAALERALCQAGTAEAKKPRWSHDPYPGLDVLDHWQAPIFFGRETETDELCERLSADPGQGLLIVTGASGSGKSSLVRAGLWARLQAGEVPRIPGGERWVITAMAPTEWGDDPFFSLVCSLDVVRASDPALAWLRPGDEHKKLGGRSGAFADLHERVLAGRPSTAEWLLVLDQMEELFTLVSEERRNAFLTFLLEAVKLPRFRVVATVRADFLQACIAHDGLRRAMNIPGVQYNVGRPDPLSLARMVSGPINEVSLVETDADGHEHPVEMTVERGLVRKIAAEAAAQPGGLALMAFALRDLYQRCRKAGSSTMDLATYESEDFGGIKGVIVRRAQDALARAGEGAEEAVPRVFSRLLTVDEQCVATRRRERRDHWAADRAAEALIEEFSKREARLLVLGKGHRERETTLAVGDQPVVEVAHEALLREWPLLKQWIDQRCEALRLRQRVEEEARAWRDEGRPDYLRWKHERLAPAHALLAEADLLDQLEQEDEVADFLTSEPDWLLAELLCSGTDHIRREDIGRRVSEVGDPRPGVGVVHGVPDILWCPIPGGEVEIRQHGGFEVKPFQMATYPVTYVQYQAFVDAMDGHRAEAWWDGLRKEIEPRLQLRRYASYPADSVSWYGATAFCRWLSAKLGYEVRLPDEWEWQWAAQSAEPEFLYPWGRDWCEGLANTWEAVVARTMAVGMYPQGRSVQGVYDLAGNVWEWCRNGYDSPRDSNRSHHPHRVLRGGSAFDGLEFARTSYRDDAKPSYCHVRYGLRVVRASTHSL